MTNSGAARIPPQNLDAEKALLGSIMLKPDVIHDIADTISADSFYSEKHRIIFDTMMDLASKATPIDLLSVTSRLKEKKLIEKVGGGSYVSELLEAVPSAANIKHYAEIVQKKAKMRQLIEASEYISQLGFEEASELDALLDKAEKKVFEVTNVKTNKKFTDIKDTLGDVWDRIDEMHKAGDQLRGVSTGFKALDAKLSGLQKSDLIILAARPSMGKTSLALDIARQAALKSNIAVGIFSLEMSAQQLIDRMLATEAAVDSWKLRTGKLNPAEDFDRIRDALARLSKAPIYVDDTPGTNILTMRAMARRLKAEKDLGLIIVDYLQLMSPTQSKNSDNVVQQITEISRSLKGLAREIDVPVLALSQLSRAVESRGGSPRLSDLRDSGSIEQDADVVMFIHNPTKFAQDESEKSNVTQILIEKHRNGPTGMVELYFDADRSSFKDIDKSEYNNDIDHF